VPKLPYKFRPQPKRIYDEVIDLSRYPITMNCNR